MQCACSKPTNRNVLSRFPQIRCEAVYYSVPVIKFGDSCSNYEKTTERVSLACLPVLSVSQFKIRWNVFLKQNIKLNILILIIIFFETFTLINFKHNNILKWIEWLIFVDFRANLHQNYRLSQVMDRNRNCLQNRQCKIVIEIYAYFPVCLPISLLPFKFNVFDYEKCRFFHTIVLFNYSIITIDL